MIAELSYSSSKALLILVCSRNKVEGKVGMIILIYYFSFDDMCLGGERDFKSSELLLVLGLCRLV